MLIFIDMVFRIGGIYYYDEENKEIIPPYTIGKLWYRDSQKRSRWIENHELIFIIDVEKTTNNVSIFKVLIGNDIGWIYTEEKYWKEFTGTL